MGPAADHLTELAQALLDEERARDEVRAVLNRQADLLRLLRSEGMTLPEVAHRVVRARGLVLPIAERLRLAERLRKRVSRRTTRPPNLAGSHGLPPTSIAPSDRALTPDHQESNMAKLVKRTITEEFIESKKPDEDQDEVEEDVSTSLQTDCVGQLSRSW